MLDGIHVLHQLRLEASNVSQVNSLQQTWWERFERHMRLKINSGVTGSFVNCAPGLSIMDVRFPTAKMTRTADGVRGKPLGRLHCRSGGSTRPVEEAADVGCKARRIRLSGLRTGGQHAEVPVDPAQHVINDYDALIEPRNQSLLETSGFR